jgi:hypothetical protein
MTGFDYLPLVIYNHLSSYLSFLEYLHFLNCSKSLFSLIKYETGYYVFPEIHKFITLAPYTEGITEGVGFCLSLINKTVKNRYKQVKLSIKFQLRTEFYSFYPLFDRIHHLIIDCEGVPFFKLPLHLFRGVYRLELHSVKYLRSLSGLAPLFNEYCYDSCCLQELIIKNAYQLSDTSDLKKIPSLRKLELQGCPSLDFSDLKGVAVVTLKDISPPTWSFGLSQQREVEAHHESFSYYVDSFDEDFFEHKFPVEMFSYFNQTENLCIIDVIFLSSSRSSDNRLCVLRNNKTKNLTLAHGERNLEGIVPPIVPVFPCVETIDLECLDLSLWVQPLPNLKKADLKFCIAPSLLSLQFISSLRLSECELQETINCSIFHNLLSLEIDYCKELKSLIFAKMSCARLLIIYCKSLETIFEIGDLKYLGIHDCEVLSSIIVTGESLHEVILEELPLLKDFSFLAKAQKVTVKDCGA